MPYIGNTVQTQGFTPAIDYFSGNGVTVTFTLSRPVASVAQMIVAIDNVIQNPSFAFTVAGNAITFTSAPLSGTNNIWVEYTSLITTYNAISQDPTVIGDITTTGGGLLSTGDFGNAYLSGVIVDYVTGIGRVTVGPSEAVTLYNGGSAGRNALLTANSTGVGIGTTSPAVKLDVNKGSAGSAARFGYSGGAYGYVYADSQTAYFGSDTNASNSWGANSTSNFLVNYTLGIERMRIDSNGYVTMPYQPNAALGLNASQTSAGVIIWTVIHNNVGSCYNSGTGRFTAPVAGYYLASIMCMTDASAVTLDIELQKNGATNNQLVPYQSAPPTYNQVSGMTIISLAAGDTINFKLNSGSIYGGGATGRHGACTFRLMG